MKDLAMQAYNKGIYTYSSFLSEAEISDIYGMEREIDFIGFTLFGGFEDSTRKLVRFGSLEQLGYDEAFPISCVEIVPVNMKFGEELSHRDYLGALMNLGVERDSYGDILVQEEGATCFVQRHMAAFVMDNLLKVGSCAVHVEEVPLPEAVEQETAEEFSATVAQLRLDSVVAAAFRVSRTKAAEYIAAGAVKHNHLPCLDRDKSLQEGDVLSLRGFGRATLLQVGGRSKKDRIFITVTRP